MQPISMIIITSNISSTIKLYICCDAYLINNTINAEAECEIPQNDLNTLQYWARHLNGKSHSIHLNLRITNKNKVTKF